MDAKSKLVVLRDQWADCTKCGLSKTRGRSPVLFGHGPYNADFFILVEAPGEDDINEGLHMSGVRGELITSMLAEAGVDAEREVFITSLVACRPFSVIPATEESNEIVQDRGAIKDEIAACMPRLLETIYLVDPRVIITMGEAPWKALVPPKSRERFKAITAAAGELFETIIPGRAGGVCYPVMATLPPQHLLANPSRADHGPITTTIEILIKTARYVRAIKEDEK